MEVEVEVEGRKYSGWFELSKGVLTVTTPSGRKSTQLGASTRKGLAEMLLRELGARPLNATLSPEGISLSDILL